MLLLNGLARLAETLSDVLRVKGGIMRLMRKVSLVSLLMLPGYSFAGGLGELGGGELYIGAAYAPAALKEDVLRVRNAASPVVGKLLNITTGFGGIEEYDTKLGKSAVGALGIALGYELSGVGLELGLDNEKFSARKRKVREREMDKDETLGTKAALRRLRITDVSSTTVSVNMCYRWDVTGRRGLRLSACGGGGGTLVSIAPGERASFRPSYKLKAGLAVRLGEGLTLETNTFFTSVLGDGEYNLKRRKGSGAKRTDGESHITNSEVGKVVAIMDLTHVGVELRVRFNLPFNNA